jgi:vacuolar-type H+-ATPase subunit F/Vma7
MLKSDKELELRESLKRLFENDDFKLVIIDEYLGSNIRDIVLQEDLYEPRVLDELKARQSLRMFFEKILN